MFSPSMPFTSLRPMPPTPMQATLSLSLGARNPRPRTWRGTMANATPAPTSPTNFRLEMRLRDMMRRSSIGRHGFGRARATRAKQRCEEEQDDRGEPGGQHPEAGPTLEGQAGGAAEQPVVHVAGHLGADEHTAPVGHQHEESLRQAAHRGCGLLVHVDLTGHEKEVVADAVEQDADDYERGDRCRRRDRKESIAEDPG